MSKFEDWYEQHKAAIHLLKDRRDVAFYTWTNKPTKISATRSAKKEGGYSQDFETFWDFYPNKTAKHVAFISYNKVKPPILDLMAALEWQVKQENWTKDSGKYIPHAATYLNQRRWLDEKPKDLKESKGEAYTDMNGIVRYR